MDAVTAAEKLIFPSLVEIVECTGYAAGADLPVASKTYTLAGTGSFLFDQEVPGQDAALVRYDTTARSTKNHPIYLFNYYHGVGSDSTVSADELDHAQKTAIETYASAWLTGFSDGTITVVRAGPNGATATARLVHQYLTHRDFRK